MFKEVFSCPFLYQLYIKLRKVKTTETLVTPRNHAVQPHGKLVLEALLAFLVLVFPSSAESNPSSILSLTETCIPLEGIDKFKTDESTTTASNQMCQLKGAIWFKADMDIDCDGGSTIICKNDRSYQSDTSCVTSSGEPLDAAKLPFIVLPQNSNGWRDLDYGIRCGNVAAVIYNGKVEFGIVGDRGPEGVVGEASYAMAERLGVNPDPNSGGTASGVTYIVFTGSNAIARPTEDHDRAVEIGESLLTELITQNSASDNIGKVKFQKPSQGQTFLLSQPVTFEGTTASDVIRVKLVADDRWELASVLTNQGVWSATYRFSGVGNRQITALGFDVSGKQIAVDTISVRIQSDK